ncbi:WYL domain-containing protein [Brevibacillus borstelensis]|uniref:WYL domain-containing protein n=1 Tax=Brevibacillus borstelensis TaxID=45462 RepID=UPI0030BDC579
MNLFEKIFNYQLISRLDDCGTFTITAHERSWLKTMLAHPAAEAAFTTETLNKLRSLLEPAETVPFTESLGEKAKSRERHVYHPLLRLLRRILAKGQGIRITYRTKNGRVNTGHMGLPYKLEYSMVKKEWYLLWYHFRHQAYMATRLQSIVSVSEQPLERHEAAAIRAKIEATLKGRKETAVIEVVRLYNRELSRILYAFSCFEKKVEYVDQTNTYRITLTFLADDGEYILSKIRFLGKRVRVIQGERLQRRMCESAAKALSRYGIE